MTSYQTVLDQFLVYLAVQRGMSPHTVAAYRNDLQDFGQFFAEPLQADERDIKNYLEDVHTRQLTARTQARRLASLRALYRFLVREKLVTADPTQHVKLPKMPQSLPKALSEKEIHQLMHAASGSTPKARRLQLILELLYATGLRVSELVTLKVSDVQASTEGVLQVTGKGSKTRLVPLGETTAITLKHYLAQAWPHFNKNGDWLFPSTRAGQPLTRQRIFQLLQKLGEEVGITVAPHHLRHTFATHLLDHDADLRAVQLMLGHASLQTTQIYTKVANARLAEVVDKYHPLNQTKK